MDNYFATFHGYPTYFDGPSNSWRALCEGSSCVIEVVSPPAIFLKQDGTVIHGIQLKETFVYLVQSATGVMVRTSNDSSAAMYGFAFASEEVGKSFENALTRLRQHYRPLPTLPTNASSPPEGTTAARPPVVKTAARPPVAMKQNFVAPDETNSFKKRFPLTTAFKEGVADMDTDKVNELIMDHGNAIHEQEELCLALSEAIKAGNIQESKKIVAELVNKKVKVKATLCEDKLSKFNIKIYVESINMQLGDPITLPVGDPETTTIRDLKKEMLEKYDFPTSVQRFIIRDRLTRDTDTLSYCGINSESDLDRHKIYLYLKPLDDTGCAKQTQTDEKLFTGLPVMMKPNPYLDLLQFPAQQEFPRKDTLPRNDFPPRDVFPPQQDFLPHGFVPKRDFPAQRDYPPQGDLLPQKRDFPPRDFPPQQDFPPRDFPPQQAFPAQHGFVPQQGNQKMYGGPARQEFPPQPAFSLDPRVAEFEANGTLQNIEFSEVRQEFQKSNENDLFATVGLAHHNSAQKRTSLPPQPGEQFS